MWHKLGDPVVLPKIPNSGFFLVSSGHHSNSALGPANDWMEALENPPPFHRFAGECGTA